MAVAAACWWCLALLRVVVFRNVVWYSMAYLQYTSVNVVLAQVPCTIFLGDIMSGYDRLPWSLRQWRGVRPGPRINYLTHQTYILLVIKRKPLSYLVKVLSLIHI